MSQILAFSGKKQSGKNTLCNFLHGYQLKSYSMIDGFEIADTGELVIETSIREEGGKISKGKGQIDVTRLDIEFVVWAMDNIWPFVKHYAFATSLKEMGIGLFDIDRNLVYGTDEQKNQPTQYKWEDMPTKVKGKSGFITGREFMQYFGTEICRKIYPDIWTDRLIKDIQAEEPNLAIISDARFENEIKAVQAAGGKVIRLTRTVPGEDYHDSEVALDSYDGFDAIIDTQNLGIEASCQKLIEILGEWRWFDTKVLIAPEKPSRKQTTMAIK
jgi:hypothetical protein